MPEMRTAEPICALRDVGKSFGGVFACRHVDLEVMPGEVLALTGENGAGKSTSMKCLVGLYPPTEGHVEVAGRRVDLKSPRDGDALGIAMIPQELDLFAELSIVENLYVGRDWPRTRWGGFDWAEMRRRARETLAGLGVDFDVMAPVKRLSAANGKLIEIARALMRNARVVVMDEPTAALTDREVVRLFAIIRDLKARGISVIYISHRLDEIFAIADRIAVLRDGALLRTDRAEAFDKATLVQLMVGRPLEQLFARQPHPPGEAILEVRNLSRRGAFTDVSFTLHRGEVLGIAGLIGAGRSELAEAIYGIMPADGGEILVRGRAVAIRRVADALALGIGHLPEERRSQGLILSFSIARNISFSSLGRFTRLGFLRRRAERRFAEEAARRLTVVGADVSAPVASLSGGNQQKVVIAKTLARQPEIVILDEPTRGVDVGAKSQIYRIIDQLAGEGRAILLISSEMNEVLSMSDRILVMHEGRLVRTFARNEFSANAIGAAAAGHELSHAA
jgi:ABC-type sugar transport system ATPase subunit